MKFSHWGAAACLAVPLQLVAQGDAEPERLPTITVTADPFAGRSPVEAIQASEVISGSELDETRSQTLGETLGTVPGVQSADFSAGASRPVIRGLGGPRVRVLEGGTGVLDASTVSPDHNVALEPFRAEQVEILKGPATLLYGSGAIGGVVNVVSDLVPDAPVGGPHGEIGLRGSSVDDGRSLHGHAGTDLGPLSLHIDGLRRETEDYSVPGRADADGEGPRGYVPNSATETDSLGLGLSWTHDQGFVGVGYTLYDTVYGVPGHAHGDEDGHGEEHHDDDHHDDHADEEHDHHDEGKRGLAWLTKTTAAEDDHAHGEDEEAGVYIDLEQRRGELRGEWRPQDSWIERWRGALVVTDYRHVEIEPAHADEHGEHDDEDHHEDEGHHDEDDAHHDEETGHGHGGTVFANDGLEARLELGHRPWRGWRGVFGMQLVQQDFSITGEEAFVPPVQANNIGLFWVEERQIGAHRISLGGRVEQAEVDPQAGATREFDLVSGALGLHFELPWQQHLNVNVSHAERAPDLQALFAEGPHLATASFEQGNPDLDTETALNLGIDWHMRWPDLALVAGVFATQYRDFIFQAEQDRDGDGVADRVNEEGQLAPDAELLAVAFEQDDARFWGAELRLSHELNRQHAVSFFADMVRGQRRGGQPLPRIPGSRFGLSYRGHHESLNWSARLTRVNDQNRVSGLETPTQGYVLLGADLSWQLPLPAQDVSLSLRGRNLLDEQARNHLSFLKDLAPLPGRNGILELRWRF